MATTGDKFARFLYHLGRRAKAAFSPEFSAIHKRFVDKTSRDLRQLLADLDFPIYAFDIMPEKGDRQAYQALRKQARSDSHPDQFMQQALADKTLQTRPLTLTDYEANSLQQQITQLNAAVERGTTTDIFETGEERPLAKEVVKQLHLDGKLTLVNHGNGQYSLQVDHKLLSHQHRYVKLYREHKAIAAADQKSQTKTPASAVVQFQQQQDPSILFANAVIATKPAQVDSNEAIEQMVEEDWPAFRDHYEKKQDQQAKQLLQESLNQRSEEKKSLIDPYSDLYETIVDQPGETVTEKLQHSLATMSNSEIEQSFKHVIAEQQMPEFIEKCMQAQHEYEEEKKEQRKEMINRIIGDYLITPSKMFLDIDEFAIFVETAGSIKSLSHKINDLTRQLAHTTDHAEKIRLEATLEQLEQHKKIAEKLESILPNFSIGILSLGMLTQIAGCVSHAMSETADSETMTAQLLSTSSIMNSFALNLTNQVAKGIITRVIPTSGITLSYRLVAHEIAHQIRQNRLKRQLVDHKTWQRMETNRILAEYNAIKSNIAQAKVDIQQQGGPDAANIVKRIDQQLTKLSEYYQDKINEVKTATARQAVDLQKMQSTRRISRIYQTLDLTASVVANTVFPPAVLGAVLVGSIELAMAFGGEEFITNTALANHGIRPENFVLLTDDSSVDNAIIKMHRLPSITLAKLPKVISPMPLTMRRIKGAELFSQWHIKKLEGHNQCVLKLPLNVPEITVESTEKQLSNAVDEWYGNYKFLNTFLSTMHDHFAGRRQPEIINLDHLQKELLEQGWAIAKAIDNTVIRNRSLGKSDRYQLAQQNKEILNLLNNAQLLHGRQPLTLFKDLSREEKARYLDNDIKQIKQDIKHYQTLVDALSQGQTITNFDALWTEELKPKLDAVDNKFKQFPFFKFNEYESLFKDFTQVKENAQHLADGYQEKIKPEKDKQDISESEPTSVEIAPGQDTPLNVKEVACVVNRGAFGFFKRIQQEEQVEQAFQQLLSEAKGIDYPSVVIVPYSEFNKNDLADCDTAKRLRDKAEGLKTEIQWVNRLLNRLHEHNQQQDGESKRLQVKNLIALRESYQQQCDLIRQHQRSFTDPSSNAFKHRQTNFAQGLKKLSPYQRLKRWIRNKLGNTAYYRHGIDREMNKIGQHVRTLETGDQYQTAYQLEKTKQPSSDTKILTLTDEKLSASPEKKTSEAHRLKQQLKQAQALDKKCQETIKKDEQQKLKPIDTITLKKDKEEQSDQEDENGSYHP